MDDSQSAFSAPFSPSYVFDLDMSKRPMELSGGPESKKARWSPNSNSYNSNSLTSNATNGTSRNTDPFANYGYGNNAQIFAHSTPATTANFGASQLYSTPQLSLNTSTGITGMSSQLSPSSAPATFAQQLQQQQQAQGNQSNGMNGSNSNYSGYNGYNGVMSLPNMGLLNGFQYSPGLGSFPQRLPSLNIPVAQAAYSPAALSAMQAANGTAARTVYVGNLPATASVDELLNLVHFGPIESVRVLPEKSCVFISFLDGNTATAFHADATIKKLALHGQELKIGWGKASAVPSQVALSISQSNASRNVYIGGLDENMTEEQLRDDLSRFGLIDQVKIVRDKNIGFVHFLSISTATKVVATLPTEPAWAGKRVNYGKDRCAYVPKSQQAAAQAAQAAAAQSLMAQSAASMSPLNSSGSNFSLPFSPYSPFSADGLNGQGVNRTVYLGNIHPETSTEDLCNAIRGGVLQSIRYLQDKHIAFVTFVDPGSAFTFFQVASYQGMTLNNRRLKVGWGKSSGPLSPSLALAVHSGATRNVYIGNIEDFDKFSDEKLKQDFGEYGDIELVNFLKEKNCAFVNFTNISNAIKAIEGVKQKPDYANLRIAHGKDRCANPPRSGPQGGGMKRSNSGNAPASAGATGDDLDVQLDSAVGMEPEDFGAENYGLEDIPSDGALDVVNGTA